MPDIFISYKTEERPTAVQLAARFTEAGYDVWWDAALLAGSRFEDEIALVLNASRAVVVLWSRKSAASDWVKAEAESARQQNKALPVVIDDLPHDGLPLLFRGVHVADLRNWGGDADHPGFQQLAKSLKERLGDANGPSLSAPQAEAKLAQSAGEAEVWAAIAGSADPSAAEYRAYLKRFGATARFAELAEIRIARLEQREGAGKDPGPPDPRRRSFNWRPAIILPFVALLLIAGAALWYWLARDPNPISADVREAGERCAAWATGSELDWNTGLPVLKDNLASECQKAADGIADNGDYQAMLAMVRIEQDFTKTNEALTLAQRGADLKSGLANYVLGVMNDRGLKTNERGIKMAVDPVQAADYFKLASEQGVPRAAGRLCLMAEDNDGQLPFTTEWQEVLAFCQHASDAADSVGQLAMGYLYENGFFHLPFDEIKAESLYRKAADQGSIAAKVQLGALLTRGTAVTRDPAQAFGLFEAGQKAGYPEGFRWLGIAYELGIGVAPDINRASQLYETATYRYDPIAALLVGAPPFPKGATSRLADDELDKLTLDQSNAVGQRLLGGLLQIGYLDHQQSNAQAAAAYEKCAGTNPLCGYLLGLLYRYPARYGDMFPTNLEIAAGYFEKGAAAGEMHNQFELGQMYEFGEGKPRDMDKAVALYQLSAAQGYWAAQGSLDDLRAPPPPSQSPPKQ